MLQHRSARAAGASVWELTLCALAGALLGALVRAQAARRVAARRAAGGCADCGRRGPGVGPELGIALVGPVARACVARLGQRQEPEQAARQLLAQRRDVAQLRRLHLIRQGGPGVQACRAGGVRRRLRGKGAAVMRQASPVRQGGRSQSRTIPAAQHNAVPHPAQIGQGITWLNAPPWTRSSAAAATASARA